MPEAGTLHDAFLDELRDAYDAEKRSSMRRRWTSDPAGQRAEHYEMAAYGTLVAWAQAMGHTRAARLLQQTLDEEKAADQKLSALAEGGINQGAADAAHTDEELVGAGASGARKSPAKAGRRWRQVRSRASWC